MGEGCPNDTGRAKTHLQFTLVDFLDTTSEELSKVGHSGGVYCKCTVCQKLKTLEDKFILRSGTFYSQGLNSRNEIRNKSRVNWG